MKNNTTNEEKNKIENEESKTKKEAKIKLSEVPMRIAREDDGCPICDYLVVNKDFLDTIDCEGEKVYAIDVDSSICKNGVVNVDVLKQAVTMFGTTIIFCIMTDDDKLDPEQFKKRVTPKIESIPMEFK